MPRGVGFADFLLRADTPSDLGAHSYEAYDTKLAKHPKPYFILQLGFYTAAGASKNRSCWDALKLSTIGRWPDVGWEESLNALTCSGRSTGPRGCLGEVEQRRERADHVRIVWARASWSRAPRSGRNRRR